MSELAGSASHLAATVFFVSAFLRDSFIAERARRDDREAHLGRLKELAAARREAPAVDFREMSLPRDRR